MKCKLCSNHVGSDPRDSLIQGRCWRHATGDPRQPDMEEQMVIACRLPECSHLPRPGSDGYCEEHWQNFQSWLVRVA